MTPRNCLRILTLLACMALFSIFCTSLLAAEAAAAATQSLQAAASSPWLAIIPLLVPGVVALVKFFLPRVPGPWLPVIAAGIGLMLALLDHFTGSLGGNPMAVAFMGAAGVGIREIYDQVKKAAAAALPPAI